MRTSETVTKISPAILKAQKSMSSAKKDSNNPFFKSKYADLNAIREAVIPALNDNGITVLQTINGDKLDTVLLHESGEFIASSINIVIVKQNDPQAYGSAISYARRYSLQSMLCVGAEDDDAETVMSRTPVVKKKSSNAPVDEF